MALMVVAQVLLLEVPDCQAPEGLSESWSGGHGEQLHSAPGTQLETEMRSGEWEKEKDVSACNCSN
jgi:hypothetical protein